jgi:hypothetical protein
MSLLLFFPAISSIEEIAFFTPGSRQQWKTDYVSVTAPAQINTVSHLKSSHAEVASGDVRINHLPVSQFNPCPDSQQSSQGKRGIMKRDNPPLVSFPHLVNFDAEIKSYQKKERKPLHETISHFAYSFRQIIMD